MGLVFHRLIQKDLKAALFYYDAEGGEKLGDRFFEEVEACVESIQKNPQRYHFIAGAVQRAPLKNFPYHLLYEKSPNRIMVLVLRHDKRHPSFGLKRQGR